mgnify:CR=1 FL=1
MKDEILPLSNISPDCWDTYVFEHRNGSLFHSMRWLDILQRNQPADVQHLGFIQKNKIIGLFPVCIKRVLFFKFAGSPLIAEDTPYLGPLIHKYAFQNFLLSLEKYLKCKKIHFVRLLASQVFHPNENYQQFTFKKKSTHIVNLKNAERFLWDNLEGRCRTAIRKAIKNHVRIQDETNPEFIETYYTILKSVYNNQGMPCPNRKQFYYDLWDFFHGKNAFFLSATYNNIIIAGAIILIDRDKAYYLNGASRHEYRSLYPMNLILWYSLLLAKSHGASQFDFVGSDIPRLAHFKKSFGGESVNYTCIEWSSSAYIEILRKRYPLYKTFFGNIRETISSCLQPRV